MCTVMSSSPPRPPSPTRADRLERLRGTTFDLLVIGGGATGAATAWAAARAGARVALVDRGDAAGATSSASSKLVHGGLRYLKLGDVRLVREAHRERRWNASVVAPHLVRPLSFLLPVRPDSPYRERELRLGVFLYGALSGFRDGRSGKVPPEEAQRLAPGLRCEPGTSFVAYHDHQTDDARLVLAALRTAEDLGATWLNYVEVEALRLSGGRVAGAELRDRLGGDSISLAARVVVNATGPWLDSIRALEDPRAGTSVRLSKGTHVVLAADEPWSAAVTSPLPGGRVSFAIPWHGMLMLGTTDDSFEDDPSSVSPTPADVSQILGEAATSLTGDTIRPERVRASFAGLRVLPLGEDGTAATRRETVVTVGTGGMVSVAGGKLTTWRRIGVDVATMALRSIGGPSPDEHPVPVTGAADLARVAAELGRTHPLLDEAARRNLAGAYGSLAHELLAAASDDPSLYEPIVAGAPDVRAQVLYAVERELAVTAEDVLRRRTTLALRGLADEALPAVEPFLPPGRAPR